MEIEADTLENFGPTLASAVAAFHAGPPHCPHTVEIQQLEGIPVTEEKEFYIRCLRCEGIRELRTTIPKEMVAALTLLFHTSHEGHPIEIQWNGRTWRSPGHDL